MRTSEIETCIRGEHAELRSLLEGIADLLSAFEGGHVPAARALRERGLELCERLGRHVELEESLLLPLLRERGGESGLRRAERLVHEHHEQRELLRYLTGRLVGARLPSVLVARELEAFSQCLAMDMAHEESGLLAELAASAQAVAER